MSIASVPPSRGRRRGGPWSSRLRASLSESRNQRSMVGRIRSLGLNGLSVAQFRSAHVKGGIAVVSLTVPRHPLSPLLAVAAAAAVTVGLVAAPGLADQARDNEWWLTEVHVTKAW